MKHVRSRLTYANVMSSVAVFLVLGGVAVAATHLAKNSVGRGQIRRNAVRVGKIAPEAVRAGKLAKNSIAADRLRNGAVSTAALQNGAVTGPKVDTSTLGEVPSAKNAETLGGLGATAFPRQASSSTTNALTSVSGTARAVSIVAPQNGYLLAVASGGVYNNGSTKTFTECRLNLDGDDLAASSRGSYVSEDVPRADCATNAVMPVSAGEHRISFNFRVVPSDGGVGAAELDVVFVPLEG